MTVEMIAIGGYEEVGKNMTAVKVNDDVIIFDMGIHLDRINIHEDTDIDRMHSLDLIERGVIPDDTLMKDVDGKLKKTYIKIGNKTSGDAVLVLGGLTMQDYIAFPYFDEAVEGVKTVQKPLDELYN